MLKISGSSVAGQATLQLAGRLAGEWGEEVLWTLPPEGVKDVREWLLAQIADGLSAA